MSRDILKCSIFFLEEFSSEPKLKALKKVVDKIVMVLKKREIAVMTIKTVLFFCFFFLERKVWI